MGRCLTYQPCQLLILGLVAALAFSIWTLWLGVNSDKDNIHPLLNQLIPAGHCACRSATIFSCDSCLQCSASTLPPSPSPPHITFDPNEYSYNETQCHSFFPGLFEDPTRAQTFWQAKNGIRRADLDNVQMMNGMV
ncbi:hypothetical protein KXX13_005614 [Aspergillus fumigatus]|nr:hypothetical protein KXX13_005614 [Aspergillus fumigatus]KAH1516830.1 hypothetical protein KXX29_008774 [Aspergillus fumigatus]KAH1531164.1 hypothetical protein KXX18_007336 [Aspergillus fumigatus]KAH1605763.1 hypothetical protein KXX44_001329 [Aspergillus fumigatus]KAH1606817.1 hypothetical protein KXX21_005716 [Aspergillus fumigatus]